MTEKIDPAFDNPPVLETVLGAQFEPLKDLTNVRGARFSDGDERNGEYPIADFYKPLEYAWSEVPYEADQALKQYIEGSQANR